MPSPRSSQWSIQKQRNRQLYVERVYTNGQGDAVTVSVTKPSAVRRGLGCIENGVAVWKDVRVAGRAVPLVLRERSEAELALARCAAVECRP